VKEWYDIGMLLKQERNKITKNPQFKKFLLDRPHEAADVLLKHANAEEIRLLKQATGDNFPAVQQSLVKAVFSEEQLGPLTPAGIRRRINSYGIEAVEAVMGKNFIKEAEEIAVFLEGFQKGGKNITPVGNKLLQHIVKVSPENIATNILKSSTPLELRQLESAVGPSTMKQLQQGHLSKILELKGEKLIPKDIIDAFRDIDEPIRKELFKDAPNTLQEVEQLVRVMERLQGPIKKGALSPFEEGSRAGTGLLTFIQGNIMLKDPIRGLEIVLRAGTFAKLLLLKAGRQWLTEGLTVSPATAAGRLARGLTSDYSLTMITRLMGLLSGEIDRPTILPQKRPVAAVNQAEDFDLNPRAGELSISSIGGR